MEETKANVDWSNLTGHLGLDAVEAAQRSSLTSKLHELQLIMFLETYYHYRDKHVTLRGAVQLVEERWEPFAPKEMLRFSINFDEAEIFLESPRLKKKAQRIHREWCEASAAIQSNNTMYEPLHQRFMMLHTRINGEIVSYLPKEVAKHLSHRNPPDDYLARLKDILTERNKKLMMEVIAGLATAEIDEAQIRRLFEDELDIIEMEIEHWTTVIDCLS